MVALAECTLNLLLIHPMINGATEKHEKHTRQEKDDTERHLPADAGGKPHHPDGAKGKNGTAEVRPGIACLPFNWPRTAG